jgi:D-beta-D-heptose 7-phosphate kinase/D-beta-D-heptose 1-phosphate adenosyltransferase
MVDPKPKNFSFYKGATVITPNAKEAGEASGIPVTDFSSLKKAGRILLNKSRCSILIVTQGEEGMTVLDMGCGLVEPPFHVSKTAFQETIRITRDAGFKPP